jgi:hypothetical protein
MPVYKDSFVDTIKPSRDDILECIRYYRARGGTVEMFINDDGLQLQQQMRRPLSELQLQQQMRRPLSKSLTPSRSTNLTNLHRNQM